MRTIRLLMSLAVLAAAAPLMAQTLADARQLYDAGKYGEAIEAVAAAKPEGPAAPRLWYLEAQSRERLAEAGEGPRGYERLAQLDQPVWQSIAESGAARSRKEPREAIAAATRAVSQDPAVAEAHYQLGLSLADGQDFAKAAAAFDKAAQLDPKWAYARYYAGLSYYKAKRIDLLAERFEAFLKLAPDAPERPEVESIMRTLRGR